MNDKIKLLKNISIFSRLDEKDLQVIAQYSQFSNYQKGEIIFSEGSTGNELYLVRDGEVLITKLTVDGEERDIARFINGETFGEMDLFENATRTATARAEKDSTLLVFPMKGNRLIDIMQGNPDIFARILNELLSIIAGRIRHTNKLISEKTQWVEGLRKQMINDKLTGLYNRTFLEEDLGAHLPRYGNNTSLMVIKPDNFKHINDTFGHDAGDKVLRLLADTIKLSLREDDIAIRYRGDEFAAVLPGIVTEEARSIAEVVKSAISNIETKDFTDNQSVHLTVSIGVATYPLHAEDHLTLIDKAHEKMWDARNSGGNQIYNE
jgi:diguanylate cyclase (GGDEF)-like protein